MGGWRGKGDKYKTPTKANRLDAWPIHSQILQLDQLSFNPPISIGRQSINLAAYILMHTHIHINPWVRTRNMSICSFSDSLPCWQEKNYFFYIYDKPFIYTQFFHTALFSFLPDSLSLLYSSSFMIIILILKLALGYAVLQNINEALDHLRSLVTPWQEN